MIKMCGPSGNKLPDIQKNRAQMEIPLQHFMYDYSPIGMTCQWGRASYPVIRTGQTISGFFQESQNVPGLSFDGISNAFPVEYFDHHTIIKRIRFRIQLKADCAHLKIIHAPSQGPFKVITDQTFYEFSGSWETEWLEIAGLEGRLYLELDVNGSIEINKAAWIGEIHESRNPSFLLSITAFKKNEYILPLLDSLCHYPHLRSIDLKILVVDNGGTLHPEILPEDSRILFIQQKNLGCTSGFMRALSEARSLQSDYLIIADDDISLPPEILYRMMIFQSLSNKPLSVGACMLTFQKPEVLWEKGAMVPDTGINKLRPLHKRKNLNDSFIYPELYRDDSPEYTALWLMSSPTDRLSYLPAFFIYYEDILQGLYLGKKGVQIVVPPHIFLWHATLEKRGAFWKRYLWLRNDLVTRYLNPEKMRPLQIVLSFIKIMSDLVLSYDYQLADVHLQAFRETISDARWTTDPLGEQKRVEGLMQKSPDLHDLSLYLPEDFKKEKEIKPHVLIRILKRAGYVVTLGNYINPFSRSLRSDGRMPFRFHGDYEAWGWFGYHTLAVIDKTGTGYVCNRSIQKAASIMIDTFFLSMKFLVSCRDMISRYQSLSGQYEKSWIETFKTIDGKKKTENSGSLGHQIILNKNKRTLST